MRDMSWLSAVLCVLSAVHVFPAPAHTEARTNALIRSMLKSALARPTYDARTQSFKTMPRTVSTQQEFFACEGDWSEDAKRAAFDWYLRHLSVTAIQRGMIAGRQWSDNPLACAAITQCEVMSYTNALPIFVENVNKGFDQSRILAIRVAIAWSPMGSDLTDMVEGIVTNDVLYITAERNAAYRYYCTKLCEAKGCPDSILSGVDAMYMRREDPVGAVAIDKMLVMLRPGYSNSAERCECALSVLNSADSTGSCSCYFSNVTNELNGR